MSVGFWTTLIPGQCLQAGEMSVRLASLRACCCFVESLENPADRAKFQDLLPAMLQTLGGALQAGAAAFVSDHVSFVLCLSL